MTSCPQAWPPGRTATPTWRRTTTPSWWTTSWGSSTPGSTAQSCPTSQVRVDETIFRREASSTHSSVRMYVRSSVKAYRRLLGSLCFSSESLALDSIYQALYFWHFVERDNSLHLIIHLWTSLYHPSVCMSILHCYFNFLMVGGRLVCWLAGRQVFHSLRKWWEVTHATDGALVPGSRPNCSEEELEFYLADPDIMNDLNDDRKQHQHRRI